MSDKLFEIEDQVAELKLRAEALKALTNVFGDAFATAREPEELAQAIRNRPSVYQHLWYLIVDIIDKMATAAGEIEDRLDDARKTA